ncbi:hypothetical protein QVD17_08527 [Tagetes erecta]|uniref:CCHC-type domain-containing protein n=1 Tax=Tagetes erecta TaxID=13708 RepID=A0AAD8L308_TARER|nr:hypothetical protein QVD17_08527 [Tagetes erecta]
MILNSQIQRLLDSLPPEWSLQVKTLKKERRFSDYKLLDVINKLKSSKLDIKIKEFFEAVIQPQTNTPNVALISSMISKSDYKPFKMIEKLKSMVANSDSPAEIEETLKENNLKGDEGKKEAEDEEMMKVKEEERKRNTRVCNCDKALAVEKVIMGLPYEVIQDMCSSACKIRLFGVYKANKMLLTNQAELTTINTKLKKNEVSFSIKINEALAEIDLLKRNLYERNVKLNLLSERLILSQFESTKLQTKLDKWTVASMNMNELASKQREARVKDGVGYDTEVQTVFPPPFTVCHSPTPKPHPKNDLFEQESNSLHAGLEGVNLKEVRDDYDSLTGMGYSQTGTDSQANDCSIPVVSNPVTVASTNFFDKFKVGEIPIFEPVKNVKEEIVQELPNHQAPITSTHPIPINQDPLEVEVLIEDWTSSDDESMTKESLGDSKIKMLSTTVKSEMIPKPESRQIRISLPATKQVSHPQKKKSSHLSIISQVCKRLEKKQVKISSNIQKSKRQKAPLPSAPHEPLKHQKPFKACFKCGKGDHVIKKCPKGHASDGKGKTNCFSGSESLRNIPDGKGKQVCFSGHQDKNHTSLNARKTNIPSQPSHVKPVSHDSKINMTKSSKPNSYSSGLELKIISKFSSIKSKMFESKQIWPIKKREEKIIDTRTGYVHRHVSYTDENGTLGRTVSNPVY